MENINEVKLSRVWQHFKSDKCIVIFTAFRDERTYEENIRLNKKFAAELKSKKFGYFYVEGHFPENEGTEDEVEVKEDSIFAIASKEKCKELIDLTHKLANSADQDSIIVKDSSGEIYFLLKSGKKEVLKGEIKPGKLGKFYTKLRNKSDSNIFVFESERDGKGFTASFREYLEEQGSLTIK